MSSYGLSTLQKNNFELASKLFVTAKNPRTIVRGFLLFHYYLFPLPSSLKNLVVLVELSLPCGKLSSLRE